MQNRQAQLKKLTERSVDLIEIVEQISDLAKQGKLDPMTAAHYLNDLVEGIEIDLLGHPL